MASDVPPNSGAPQPPPKPLFSIVEEGVAPWAEAANELGLDIIKKNQEPPPKG